MKTSSSTQPRSFCRTLFGRVGTAGLVVALLFWIAAVRPTLLPRPWVIQAVISALSLLIGYGIGALIAFVYRLLQARVGWRWPGEHTGARIRLVVGIVGAVLGVAGAIAWQWWQTDQRDLVGMPHLSAWVVIPMLLVTALLLVVLLGVCRIVGFAVARFDHWMAARLTRWGAHAVVAVVLVILAVVFANGFIGETLIGALNSRYGQVDTSTKPGVARPTSAAYSGSPQSLVPWDTLGMEGRNFVAGGVTVPQLQAFAGPQATAKEPIRVYAGLKSAGSASERATLAVRELERTGAFSRSVLCVWTVTGTGWVDPVAAHALEYMWAGDTAIVGLQYSYLPSWISFLVDADKCNEAGKALNDAVYARWSQLSAGSRPKLIAFGESLGSRGTEAAFIGADAAASVANVVSRTDGALETGPTNTNQIWRQLVSAREPGSPVWRPVYDAGTAVRFINRPDELDSEAPWEAPRMLYVQHPSDPVTWWNWQTFWKRPDWTRDPKGYDVPQAAGWLPIVTWIQASFDLIAGFSAEVGHGHNYNNAFVAGWAAVVPPPGWTAADSARLQELSKKGW